MKGKVYGNEAIDRKEWLATNRQTKPEIGSVVQYLKQEKNLLKY